MTNVQTRHETTNSIVKKVKDLKFLWDNLIAQKQGRTKTQDDEDHAMQNHMENLSSYKNYLLDLAEKGTAFEVSEAMVDLDRSLKVLEVAHETRMRHTFNIQQKLLDQMLLDSFRSRSLGLPDMSAGNTRGKCVWSEPWAYMGGEFRFKPPSNESSLVIKD